jgi:hypothetical protein
MKSIKKISLVIAILFGTWSQAQEFSETIKEEHQFPSQSSENLLVVYNVYGDIKVEGYSGNSVKMEAVKTIYGKKGRSLSNRALEIGKKEVNLKTVTKDDIIYVYLDTPFSHFNIETGRFRHNEANVQRKYSYTLDITIKVPNNSSLMLSAVNNGDIVVKNVEANSIEANNINGGITLDNISGKIDVNALNRSIDVSFSKNPTEDSYFNSLNGNITVLVKDNLNANVSFKGLNGSVYTNLETQQSSTSNLKMIKKSGRNKGMKYKLNRATEFMIGKGGVKLDFDLLNGNVTIKG